MRHIFIVVLILSGTFLTRAQAAATPASAATYTLTGSAQCFTWKEGGKVKAECIFNPIYPIRLSELKPVVKGYDVDDSYNFSFKNTTDAATKLGWSGSTIKPDSCYYSKNVTIKVTGNPKQTSGDGGTQVALDLVSVNATGEFKIDSKDQQPEDCKLKN